jgi:hypothetical protein
MKRYGNYTLEELLNLYPFELEIFYFMTMKEIKDRLAKQAQ